MDKLNILIKPVVTEKATSHEKEGKYLFYVHTDATKVDVRNTFEKLYHVKVATVHMLRAAKKTKLGKSRLPVTKRAAYKKAIITLKEKKEVNVLKPKLKK